MKELSTIVEEVRLHIDQGLAFKITLSKPQDTSYKNIFISPFQGQQDIQLKVVSRSSTQDFTATMEVADIESKLVEWYSTHYKNLDFNGERSISLRQSKKGKVSLLTGSTQATSTISSHNKEKQYSIKVDTPFLKDLGLSSSNGQIYGHAQAKYKQINKFVEIILSLIKADRPITKVVDMGCGKGYLTFATYEVLRSQYGSDVEVRGYEIRPDLVAKCNAIAQKNGMTGLTFHHADIANADIEATDLLIALHACDIATDMAIAKALEANSQYIVLSPCCHKQIRKSMTLKDEITHHGIYQERLAEMITDTIRALLLQSKGYDTKIFEFINKEHTAKNSMITAVKGKKDKEALSKVKALKAQYGIDTHYLETII